MHCWCSVLFLWLEQLVSLLMWKLLYLFDKSNRLKCFHGNLGPALSLQCTACILERTLAMYRWFLAECCRTCLAKLAWPLVTGRGHFSLRRVRKTQRQGGCQAIHFNQLEQCDMYIVMEMQPCWTPRHHPGSWFSAVPLCLVPNSKYSSDESRRFLVVGVIVFLGQFEMVRIWGGKAFGDFLLVQF